MSDAPLVAASPDLVQHRVQEALRDPSIGDGSLVAVGIRARPEWDHGPLDVEGHPVTVAPCPSPLAIRDALQAPVDVPGLTIVVVLADLEETELSEDIRARLVKHRLIALNPWEAVKDHFSVRRLDPAFSDPDRQWFATALLEVPVDEAAPRLGGLSVERAVELVACHVLGVDTLSIDQLLLATTDPRRVGRLQAQPEPTRQGLLAALSARFGGVGALLVGLHERGHAPDALPLGLAVAGALAGSEGSYAQARIEGLTGVTAPAGDVLAAYAAVAERCARVLRQTDRELFDAVIARGDVLASELRVGDPAASSVLWSGFDERLRTLAVRARALVEEAGSGGESGRREAAHLREAAEALDAHQGTAAPEGAARAERVRLAARLAAWLAGQADPTPTNLAAAAESYADRGAHVDWARRRVAAGDPDGVVAEALEVVGRAAEARRAVENQQFASLLAAWTSHADPAAAVTDRIIVVESVLEAVVAPLARHLPVLVVVLDGAGLAAFLELAPQFRRLGAAELAPGGARRAALAALPTVTAVSRTSLLAGRLLVGTQADERRAFPAHPALAALGGQPPAVLHKADFDAPVGQALPAAVRSILAVDGPRVVAAVVNTIDDQLAKGDFAAAYRIEDLGPLDGLVRLALDAGRAVVVTADHGHVLGVSTDGTGAVDRGGEGGDRWRVAYRAPTDDEVLLRGPRVLEGGERGILAPWHDVLRYSARHGGYHGGATPDEVLVPLSVFVQVGSEAPEGWEPVVAPPPPWWDLAVGRGVAAPGPGAPPAPPTKPAKATKRADPSQGALFEPAAPTPGSPPPGPDWLEALLDSDLYQVQSGSVGRAAPKEADVRAALLAAHERGGVASFATIAQATGRPLHRMAGFLASLARVLNVDGYPVLTVDASGAEVRLDEALLRTQFLEGP